MKKPGKPKPKPKRRARPPQPQRLAEQRSTPTRGATAVMAALPRTAVVSPPRSSAQAYEERTRLALLLLPFLIVAVSLALTQTRRNALPDFPEIAIRRTTTAVVTAPTALPPLPQPVTPAPPAVLPAPGPIESARTPAPPVLAAPVLEPVAPPAVFPPPRPIIEPVIAAAAPPSPPVIAPLPGFAQFPPPAARVDIPALPAQLPVTTPASAPSQQIAALDVRPPPASIALPQPSPPAAAPIVAAPSPASDPGYCAPAPAVLASFSTAGRLARQQRVPRPTGIDSEQFGQRLAAAAVAQTRDLVIYTARYQAMAYPMGDVLALHGACIDVVIRAYRAVGIDLQEEVQRGRPKRGDTNIEHRRTENMRRFLERNGASLPISNFPEDYKPGDIVTYHRPFSRVSTSHIAIVSDVLAPTGRPMIVHNRGYGPQLEDALFVDRITGHYRYTGSPAPATGSTAEAAPAARASYSRAANAPGGTGAATAR